MTPNTSHFTRRAIFNPLRTRIQNWIDRRFYCRKYDVQQRTTLVDPRMQWNEAGSVWHNAAVRTTLYAPVNLVKTLFRA